MKYRNNNAEVEAWQINNENILQVFNMLKSRYANVMLEITKTKRVQIHIKSLEQNSIGMENDYVVKSASGYYFIPRQYFEESFSSVTD